MNNKVVVLVGPTASGKTKISVELASSLTEVSFQRIRCRFIGIWISEPQSRLKPKETGFRIT